MRQHRNRWQIKGTTNIKCFTNVFGHYESPQQLQWTLAQIVQVSGTVLQGWNANLPKRYSSSWCFDDRGKECHLSHQSRTSDMCSNQVEILWSLSSNLHIHHVSETTPIKIEMFHHSINVISQNIAVTIPSKETSKPKACQQNAPKVSALCMFPLI